MTYMDWIVHPDPGRPGAPPASWHGSSELPPAPPLLAPGRLGAAGKVSPVLTGAQAGALGHREQRD